MAWAQAAMANLAATDAARLESLPARPIPKGTRLFAPGELPQGFVVVLSGRIEVHLTGASGREILLYAVEPGQSCIQTTLGLMGGTPYCAEATALTECRVVMIPAPLFQSLMDNSAPFRGFVFRAFASRMTEMTSLLERVAFTRIEARLAAALLELAIEDIVTATHAHLAARIGSAREVVSRRLEAMARAGLVHTDRGQVRLTDPAALRRLAAESA